MYTYTDGRVAFEGRTDLARSEVDAFVRHALTRSYRKRGVPEKLMETLFDTGYAEITWRFRHRLEHFDDLAFNLTLRELPDGHVVFCTGDMADWALQRVNHALGYASAPKRVKKLRNNGWSYPQSAYDRKRQRGRQQRVQTPQAKQIKKPRQRSSGGPFAAPFELAANQTTRNVVRQQFKRQRISWKEAPKAIIHIFQVCGNWKYTAEQLVGQELWKSFHASGRRFIQYKRGCFTLRFDLALEDGRWRGDITPLTIASTKNNQDPRYRRMRDYFGGLLTGLDPNERQARQTLLWEMPAQNIAA